MFPVARPSRWWAGHTSCVWGHTTDSPAWLALFPSTGEDHIHVSAKYHNDHLSSSKCFFCMSSAIRGCETPQQHQHSASTCFLLSFPSSRIVAKDSMRGGRGGVGFGMSWPVLALPDWEWLVSWLVGCLTPWSVPRMTVPPPLALKQQVKRKRRMNRTIRRKADSSCGIIPEALFIITPR